MCSAHVPGKICSSDSSERRKCWKAVVGAARGETYAARARAWGSSHVQSSSPGNCPFLSCTNVHVLVSPFHTRQATSPTKFIPRSIAPPSSFFTSYLFAKKLHIHRPSRLAAYYYALATHFSFYKRCIQCSRLPLDHRAEKFPPSFPFHLIIP